MHNLLVGKRAAALCLWLYHSLVPSGEYKIPITQNWLPISYDFTHPWRKQLHIKYICHLDKLVYFRKHSLGSHAF